MKCLCGCPQSAHLNYSNACLHWHSDGCMEFVADVEPHETVLKSPKPTSNNYPVDGRYATPKGGWSA